MEDPIQPYACQASTTPSLPKPGDHSNSTSRSVSPPSTHIHVLVTNFQPFAQPDSVYTIQDALAHVSQPQPVKVDQSSPSEASQQVLLERLPPVLVLHLERFLYDAATESINKISKPVQFAPKLDIPLGTILLFLSPELAKAENCSWLGRSRNYGARFREICGGSALQALWGALPQWGVRKKRALNSRCAPSKRWRQWRWGSLAAH